MFDLTTIQLRNVREKAQAMASILTPGRYIPVRDVVDALKAISVEKSPVENLDIWSKQ